MFALWMKNIEKFIRQERFFLCCLAVTMFVAALPFIIGQVLTPSGAEFFGNKLIAPADYSIYYSYINQGMQGHLFMYDAFTSEAHAATLFQPLWFFVGLGARLFHLSAPVAFAAARYLSIPIFLWTLWWAAGWICPNQPRRRKVGFVMSLVASGFGGIMALIGPRLADFPWTYPDLWVSEAYTVLTLWSSAHFLLVTSGIIFVLVAVERSWAEQRWSWARWAGVVAVATLAIHPFHVLTWVIFWMLMTLWRWQNTKKFPWSYIARWVTVLAISLPMVLLYGLQLQFDVLTIQRSIQNVNRSARPWAMILSLGLPLLLAIVSVWRWKPRDERWRWLVGLAIAYCIAAYAPVLFQRRLTQGMMLPLAWLSAPMIESIIFTSRQRSTKWAIGIALGLMLSFSWLFIGGVMIKDYARDIREPVRMYYIDRDHQDLATFVRQLDPHQPLLGTLIESNVLAGQTSHQVYVGYGVETWNFNQKLDRMNAFFSSMTKIEQRQFLQREQLCFILTSPRTEAKGSAFQPQTWTDLITIWIGKELTLYQTSYCR